MRLLEQYQRLHQNPKRFPGYSIKRIAAEIADWVRLTDTKTLLDYGCGKGLQYTERRVHEQWGGIMPTLYDPAVEAYAQRPVGEFDGVICTDVLEHVPEEELDEVLSDLFGYARKWIGMTIHTGPSKKRLPDGRNLHVTQHDGLWWVERIEQHRQRKPQVRYFVKFYGGEE